MEPIPRIYDLLEAIEVVDTIANNRAPVFSPSTLNRIVPENDAPDTPLGGGGAVMATDLDPTHNSLPDLQSLRWRQKLLHDQHGYWGYKHPPDI